MVSGGGSSGLGATVQLIDRFPPWDVSEHPFLCLKRRIILQIVLQALSCWCIPALGSQPSIMTQNFCKGVRSPGGPAVLGPHLAAVGRPPRCNTKHPPKENPL